MRFSPRSSGAVSALGPVPSAAALLAILAAGHGSPGKGAGRGSLASRTLVLTRLSRLRRVLRLVSGSCGTCGWRGPALLARCSPIAPHLPRACRSGFGWWPPSSPCLRSRRHGRGGETRRNQTGLRGELGRVSIRAGVSQNCASGSATTTTLNRHKRVGFPPITRLPSASRRGWPIHSTAPPWPLSVPLGRARRRCITSSSGICGATRRSGWCKCRSGGLTLPKLQCEAYFVPLSAKLGGM